MSNAAERPSMVNTERRPWLGIGGGGVVIGGLERSSLNGMEGSETPPGWDGRRTSDGQAEAANLVGTKEQ